MKTIYKLFVYATVFILALSFFVASPAQASSATGPMKSGKMTWDHSSMKVNAGCDANGNAVFTIKNDGSGNMGGTSTYKINGGPAISFGPLNAGQSIQIVVPSNGVKMEIIVQQRPFHPGSGQAKADATCTAPTATKTRTPTATYTMTITMTPTATLTFTPTATRTPTLTFTLIPTNTSTPTATATLTQTPTPTDTVEPTYTVTLSPTPTNTDVPTYTFTPTNTDVPTPTFTFVPTATNTNTPTATTVFTLTPTPDPTATDTPDPTATDTSTPTSTPNPLCGEYDLKITPFKIAVPVEMLRILGYTDDFPLPAGASQEFIEKLSGSGYATDKAPRIYSADFPLPAGTVSEFFNYEANSAFEDDVNNHADGNHYKVFGTDLANETFVYFHSFQNLNAPAGQVGKLLGSFLDMHPEKKGDILSKKLIITFDNEKSYAAEIVNLNVVPEWYWLKKGFGSPWGRDYSVENGDIIARTDMFNIPDSIRNDKTPGVYYITIVSCQSKDQSADPDILSYEEKKEMRILLTLRIDTNQ